MFSLFKLWWFNQRARHHAKCTARFWRQPLQGAFFHYTDVCQDHFLEHVAPRPFSEAELTQCFYAKIQKNQSLSIGVDFVEQLFFSTVKNYLQPKPFAVQKSISLLETVDDALEHFVVALKVRLELDLVSLNQKFSEQAVSCYLRQYTNQSKDTLPFFWRPSLERQHYYRAHMLLQDFLVGFSQHLRPQRPTPTEAVEWATSLLTHLSDSKYLPTGAEGSVLHTHRFQAEIIAQLERTLLSFRVDSCHPSDPQMSAL